MDDTCLGGQLEDTEVVETFCDSSDVVVAVDDAVAVPGSSFCGIFLPSRLSPCKFYENTQHLGCLLYTSDAADD